MLFRGLFLGFLLSLLQQLLLPLYVVVGQPEQTPCALWQLVDFLEPVGEVCCLLPEQCVQGCSLFLPQLPVELQFMDNVESQFEDINALVALLDNLLELSRVEFDEFLPAIFLHERQLQFLHCINNQLRRTDFSGFSGSSATVF